jgi:hypothetical protein
MKLGKAGVVAVWAAMIACGGGQTAMPAPQSVDPALETQAVTGTAISEPMQILFDWSLRDRDARFSGQGVARIEPNRARVDLFGPRGEGYLSAVLEDFALELSQGVAENVPLPPPALFWNVLGVFRSPPGATLINARQENQTVQLQYAAAADKWQFRFEAGSLRHAEWTGSGEGRRTVELDAENGDGLPGGVTYRDWPAFLELRLSPTEVRKVNGFPSEIWTLRR